MVHIYVCLVLFDSLQSHVLCPPGLLCPWDYPIKNPGVGCHFLLQRISTEIELEAALAGRFFTSEPPGQPKQSTTLDHSIWSHHFMGNVKTVVPSLHGKCENCQTLFFGAPKSLQMVIAAMKLKDAYSLEGKL